MKMLDARGIEINVSDEVIFKHPTGYKKTDIFTGKIIELGKLIKVKITGGNVVNKKPASLYKLFVEPKPKYTHINDCWEAIRNAKTVDEIVRLFDDFPNWSGDWELDCIDSQYIVYNYWYDEVCETYEKHCEYLDMEKFRKKMEE